MARRSALPVGCLLALLAVTALDGCGRGPVEAPPTAPTARTEGPCAILGRRVYVGDALPQVGRDGYTDVGTLLSGPGTRAILAARPGSTPSATAVTDDTERLLRTWLVLLADDLERLGTAGVPVEVAEAARSLARADTEPTSALAASSQVIRIFRAGRCA